MSSREMRATWDALASAPTEIVVGDPARAEQELASLFARLGADPHGGFCVEFGCGPGRMTPALARRFDHVLAVDVSPAMLERARRRVTATNVEFHLLGDSGLDALPREAADVVVCYLVLQHLPSRAVVAETLAAFGLMLAAKGEAFVQLPVLTGGVAPRLWRAARRLAIPVAAKVAPAPERSAAFRGFRLTRGELERALGAARLRVVARDEGEDAPYRHSRDVFLRLARA